jgi:hypothetical protein
MLDLRFKNAVVITGSKVGIIPWQICQNLCVAFELAMENKIISIT